MATATTSGARGLDAIAAPSALTSPTRRRGRVSRGHLVMALAGVVGVVLSFAVLREREGETAVLVAAHDVRAGERVSSDDFRTARVTLTPEVLATVAKADDRRRLEGRIAGTTIAAGELVTSRTLRRRAASRFVPGAATAATPATARSVDSLQPRA